MKEEEKNLSTFNLRPKTEKLFLSYYEQHVGKVVGCQYHAEGINVVFVHFLRVTNEKIINKLMHKKLVFSDGGHNWFEVDFNSNFN